MGPCADQNGPITGYSVRYGVMGSESQLRPLSGDSSGGMTTISGLSRKTMYTVEVAAENSADVGVYSDAIVFETPGGE